jgi:ADP-heptose:LPS heptosyltransferase
MDEIETLSSLPGDWIGADGRPNQRSEIRRILVLKADHIGDLLIADQGFALLRHFFPNARIELVCGPWNIAIAKRLGWFDDVHGVNLFHEISGQQSDRSVAEAALRAGAQMLHDLRLGHFDLAIDVRYDADSRPILRNIDATYYAGYGRTTEYPFLDIVVPWHEGGSTFGSEERSIPGERFGPRIDGGGADAIGDTQGNGDLSSRRSTISLTFDIKGAATPRSCGTANDDRRLGIGFEWMNLQPLSASATPIGAPVEARPRFDAGWADREPWGRWSIANRASLSVATPVASNVQWYRAEFAMRAHVNAANPKVICTISYDGAFEPTIVEFEDPIDMTSLTLMIPAKLARRELVTTPFELSPGHYRGGMRLLATRAIERDAHLDYVLRSQIGNVELLRRSVCLKRGARGLVKVPFEVTIDLNNSPLTFEVETADAVLLDGVRIHQVNFTLDEALRTTTPVAHMGDWISLLVLRAAQILSNETPFGRNAPHRNSRLAVRPDGVEQPAKLSEVEAMIGEWKAAGRAVVGVALGCNSEIRKWPLVYFFDLVVQMLAIGDVEVVFLGGPNEQDEAIDACVQLGLNPTQHALCGATNLPWLGVLLANLDLFIGNNTGTTHFAGKVGVRTIGIYAGTNHPREWGPIGDQASWIYRNESCAPCHLTLLSDCTKGHRCMMDLLPETVFVIVQREIEAILSLRRRHSVRPAVREELGLALWDGDLDLIAGYGAAGQGPEVLGREEAADPVGGVEAAATGDIDRDCELADDVA